jgi:hypothetical protein
VIQVTAPITFPFPDTCRTRRHMQEACTVSYHVCLCDSPGPGWQDLPSYPSLIRQADTERTATTFPREEKKFPLNRFICEYGQAPNINLVEEKRGLSRRNRIRPSETDPCRTVGVQSIIARQAPLDPATAVFVKAA